MSWKVVQVVFFGLGLAVLGALLFVPRIGLPAFWGVFIPAAPALLVFAPGLWRNICPLASTSLVTRRVGLSRRMKLSARALGRLTLLAVVALLLIVPLRHVLFDSSGPATATAIIVLAVVSVGMGLVFEAKSGWCSSLCPVYPVELLYGSRPLMTVSNAQCEPCEQCVAPCPDSTPGGHPLVGGSNSARRLAGTLIVGGFAGFVWGWFHVPTYSGSEGMSHLSTAYGVPFAGFATTLGLFLVLRRALPGKYLERLVQAFALAAIACYYWYSLPALLGFGVFPGQGALVDLSETLPSWFPAASRLGTTLLFVWWLLVRTPSSRSWAHRPHPAA
jgi:hypothetical protein